MEVSTDAKKITVAEVREALNRIKNVIKSTPTEFNTNLSEKYEANVYLKREDLQIVRSYKIRGAYNKMSSLNPAELSNGIVCASAGNHAQGVALACSSLKIKGKVFMPKPTTKQKVSKVRSFGKEYIEVVLTGDTYDDAAAAAKKYLKENDAVYIHPFDDYKIIEGQGTVGLEILSELKETIDFLFVPIGGGGLISGVATVFKQLSPNTKIIGVEPKGAPAMKTSIEKGKNIKLMDIDKFVDGAAVRKVGDINLSICKEVVDEILLVPEGKACTTILDLYNEEAIVVEPAGALSIAAIDLYKDHIKGKNIVCIVSGGNNDITRTAEIEERSLLFEGLKHYFIVDFPQRPGALKQFVNNVLGPQDVICHFEYTKKTTADTGPALIGVQLGNKHDYEQLKNRLDELNFTYQHINDSPLLFKMLV